MKRYLNVGCGNKYHKDWTNIDLVSDSPYVMRYNLLNGFPFNDNNFEVVYHSQVLEHIPKEKASFFLKECHRVLKKNGIIRIVVPDLENIVDEYKKFLNENLKNPSPQSEANYEWILLEMYDQTVRNYSGGQMGKFLQNEKMVNKQYVISRIGILDHSGINSTTQKTKDGSKLNNETAGLIVVSKKALSFIIRKIVNVKRIIINLFFGEKYKIGKFRSGGEIHMWMYDRYSLSRLLLEVGFRDIKIKNSFESDIPEWTLYELDVKDGMEYTPKGLFIEAIK
jgi:predicted SAM-dependent methyltransferase